MTLSNHAKQKMEMGDPVERPKGLPPPLAPTTWPRLKSPCAAQLRLARRPIRAVTLPKKMRGGVANDWCGVSG